MYRHMLKHIRFMDIYVLRSEETRSFYVIMAISLGYLPLAIASNIGVRCFYGASTQDM